MDMKRRALGALRVAMIGLLVMTLLASSALAATTYVRLDAKTKIYKSASTKAQSATLSKSVKAKLLEFMEGWVSVSHDGITAYLPAKDLQLVDPMKLYTTCNANVYSKGGKSKLGTVGAGTLVYASALDGIYAKCSLSKKSNEVGYIRTNDLSQNKVTTATGGTDENEGSFGEYESSGGSSTNMPSSLASSVTTPAVSKIEYVIYVAQNLVGARYETHPDPPKSFDSARFTYWCFNKAKRGMLKSSSKSQSTDKRYEMVSRIADLRRGDLVYFDTVLTMEGSDHCGIYLGDNRFIHASSKAKMIIISPFTDYYTSHFMWGRRVFYD